MKKIEEIKVEDLLSVTGGINPNKGCSYFLVAANATSHDKNCANCFYTNKVDNQYICTHPSRNKDKGVTI